MTLDVDAEFKHVDRLLTVNDYALRVTLKSDGRKECITAWYVSLSELARQVAIRGGSTDRDNLLELTKTGQVDDDDKLDETAKSHLSVYPATPNYAAAKRGNGHYTHRVHSAIIAATRAAEKSRGDPLEGINYAAEYSDKVPRTGLDDVVECGKDLFFVNTSSGIRAEVLTRGTLPEIYAFSMQRSFKEVYDEFVSDAEQSTF
ncbi:hypothetical protein COV18_06375 [Candidatus Woesearchaeota archaeon CG10_big_fil_rev_8_21_14_0_10_37_12]|nr:MAG: hypothetical protein COV18_06375 [Candidatus Woesearchaeota archaeon CG10_big_fil_rev_8_21_14_0_10_37_12]